MKEELQAAEQELAEAEATRDEARNADPEPARRRRPRRRRGRRPRRARDRRARRSSPIRRRALEIGRFDMDRAARMSGARFGYWIGDTAQLALAMYRFALDRIAAKGFLTVLPPVLVREEALYGTGHLPLRRGQRLRGHGRRALSLGHGGDPAVEPPRRRDPRRRRAAAPLRRLLAVLPPRGRRRRQGHARHVPRPPVQQGGAVLALPARELVGRARAPAREHRGARAGARRPVSAS